MDIKGRYLKLLLLKYGADEEKSTAPYFKQEINTEPLFPEKEKSNISGKISPDEILEGTNIYFEKLLLRNGIKPLAISNNKSSFLGRGASSFVYRIIYNGKEAVAKITDNSNDVSIYKEIKEKRKSLGAAGKVLPEIFDILKDPDTNYFIIISEILNPLNPHLSKALFDYGKTIAKPKKLTQTLTPQSIDGIIKACVKNVYIPENNNQVKKEIIKRLNILFRMIFRSKDFDHLIIFNENPHADENEKVIFSEELNKLIIFQVRDILKKYNLEKINFSGLLEDLNDYFRIAMIKSFPLTGGMHRKDEISVAKNLPESKWLVKTLLDLQKAGLNWADLHNANLMQRADGSLVVSDPGNFHSGNSSEEINTSSSS